MAGVDPMAEGGRGQLARGAVLAENAQGQAVRLPESIAGVKGDRAPATQRRRAGAARPPPTPACAA